VASRPHSTPAFGQADLSNCEREQIHLAGSIQPHGALLVVREPDHVVVQASANAPEFLNLAGGVLEHALAQVDGNLAERIHPHLSDPLHVIPVAVRCRVGDPPADFDGLLHRSPDGGLVIELERTGPSVDLHKHVGSALETILAASSLRALCDETARIFEDLTGYDRVMVYRFDDEGHGEVFSERRKPELEAYLGNRYPASDIPQIARRLYQRNRVRVLVDVEAAPVPLTPRLSPITGQDLDMSFCFLRSMSPIHIQYLKNMGVAATLVASLMVGGRLWGLIACHHYEPRFVHYEFRAACELLAEVVATRIAALESFVQAQAELSVRRLEQRMIEAVSREGDWKGALFDNTHALLQPLGASGAALLFEDQVLSAGEVPGTRPLREIGRWLDVQPRAPVIATTALGIDEPKFAPLSAVASGLLAVRVSTTPGEYLVWFRPERVRTVTWAGNPFKPVLVGSEPSELSPRRSFAQWHQLVEGTSETWTLADLGAARLIGDTVADVVLQFRSVRTLIVQDQLAQVSRQVRQSDQPVVVVDPRGHIVLINDAFERLLPSIHTHLQSVDDLPPFFADAADVRASLQGLLRQRRVWRGEVRLETDRGDTRPLLVRADPVFSSPDRVLGFVLLFTDLTERKAVESARHRFQEGIIERHRALTMQLDSKADLVYRNLLSSIVGNAQLAALEITDGVDITEMPEKLESVRASVARTAELLEHLIWHASGGSNVRS
jgi:two-component system, chemotaxis family, sensor kinase Cph1